MASIFGQVLQQMKGKALKRAEMIEDDVLHLIEERTLARKNKDFAKGDQIRGDLACKGIALMDVGKETIWRPCVPVPVEQETQAPCVPVPVKQETQSPSPVPGQQEVQSPALKPDGLEL